MTEILANIHWSRNSEDFLDNRYSRAHQWTFDDGCKVTASSSPHIVPVPLSDPTAIDPEEAFVASLSSCHMLWFLSIAARRGWKVNEYSDSAVGQMGENERGKTVMLTVVLHPIVSWDAASPTDEEIADMHDAAHEACFIANSVLTTVRVAAREE